MSWIGRDKKKIAVKGSNCFSLVVRTVKANIKYADVNDPDIEKASQDWIFKSKRRVQRTEDTSNVVESCVPKAKMQRTVEVNQVVNRFSLDLQLAQVIDWEVIIKLPLSAWSLPELNQACAIDSKSDMTWFLLRVVTKPKEVVSWSLPSSDLCQLG
ncbi:Uncharacterized protein APZ42_006784, partial [Daphnia magna]